VLAFIARCDSFYPPDAATFSIDENRRFYEAFARSVRGAAPREVAWSDFAIVAHGPAREIPARRYRRGSSPGAATVLYLHGGGFILGGLESHHDACLGLCEGSGLEVVAIDYRLAPEHPHPAQSDDCEAAYRALCEGGRAIIVAGDSAGGNLAAGLCLWARVRALPMPIGQVLIYPSLGGDVDAGSYLEDEHAPMLTRADCLYYAGARTADGSPLNTTDTDLAPLAAADFVGLPPAFVVSADIDPLRDDSRDYVEKLRAAGVAATWRNEPQLVHGFLRARGMSARAAASFDAIVDALRRLAVTAGP
jgi:acetyl esterase